MQQRDDLSTSVIHIDPSERYDLGESPVEELFPSMETLKAIRRSRKPKVHKGTVEQRRKKNKAAKQARKKNR